MIKVIIPLFLLYLCFPTFGQQTEVPVIGAQVFIEPGQNRQEIENYFRILHDHEMTVARIRVFGSHLLQEDGSWDFSLYDIAFDAAHKYGIKLFATLFPPTDELTDLGGFKFPRSKAHLNEIAKYIEKVVTHFSAKPALYTWVLQNEPGIGSFNIPRSDLSDEVYNQWQSEGNSYKRGKGYLTANFDKENFARYYTAWYLNWLSDEVKKYDTSHYRHINPHALLDNFTEYDFKRYEQFITSLGVSLHLSWHFGYFQRQQYALGISAMCDIIRERAGNNPFWVTELQGGNVTASGYKPLCPTKQEISQWLWTSISAGSEGIIFWTLNPRKSVMEAGEWAMLNYLNEPSERLLAAALVANTLNANKDLFSTVRPVHSPVTILYNDESQFIIQRNATTILDTHNVGRQKPAMIKSLLGAYEAISAWGVPPNMTSMQYFDWNPNSNPIILLPHVVALPTYYQEQLKQYIAHGGRAIITGMTGFYNENMSCILMEDFPMAECFGGRIKEYKVIDQYFNLKLDQEFSLPAHLWRGILAPNKDAETIGNTADDPIALRHTYGKGEVIWIPSPICLAAYQRDLNPLITFYGKMCTKEISLQPIHFAESAPNVLMRLMQSNKATMALFINKQPGETSVRLNTTLKEKPHIIFGKGEIITTENSSILHLPSEETVICAWY
ncbi:beta-galactosidase [Bacteroides congonensis]